MDPTAFQSYINNYLFKRDQARQYKESYIDQANKYETDAAYYQQQAVDYRSRAKQSEDEEIQAQRDLEYYLQLAAQAEQTVQRALQEAQM